MSFRLTVVTHMLKVLHKLYYRASVYKISQNTAVRLSRRPPWKHVLFHLLSLSFTGLILSLALGNKTFARTNDDNLTSKLNAMQLVARVHEGILTMSLMSIMAAYVRYEMCVNDGVPFGLAAVAHHLSSPELIFSRAFWSVRLADLKVTERHQLKLRIIVFAAVVITALLGPSSAILLVPQVGWKEFKNPFGAAEESSAVRGCQPTFVMADYDTIYPVLINNSWVPENCDPSSIDCPETCPNSFMSGIGAWCSNYVVNGAEPNITVAGNTPITRTLIASNIGIPPVGWSAATLPMFNLSRLLKFLWIWNQRTGTILTTTANSLRIKLTFGNRHPVLQPLVQVQCSQPSYLRNPGEINVMFSYDRIVDVQDLPDTVRTPINYTIDAQDWTSRQDTQIRFVTLNGSALGALIALSFINADPINDTTILRAVFPCTIDSRWVQSDLAYEPRLSNTVFSSISDPGRMGYGIFADSRPLHIDVSYMNALNVVLDGFTLNGQSYTVFEHNLRYFYHDAIGLADLGPGEGPWQWMLSTMLSLQLADALSRIQPYVNGVMWIGKLQQAWDFCRNLDYDAWAKENDAPLFMSPEIARAESALWLETNWITDEYVYSWGLRETPSFVAFAVVGVHALVIVLHFGVAWFRKWQCNCWEDVSDLLALAIQSPAVPVLEGTSTGVNRGVIFAEPTRIQESDDGNGIVLTVGDDGTSTKRTSLDRRLVPGKKYT